MYLWHAFFLYSEQGLVHLGKGTLTVSPYQYDRTFMSPVAVGGLLATLTAFFDVKQSKHLNSYWFCFDILCDTKIPILSISIPMVTL